MRASNGNAVLALASALLAGQFALTRVVNQAELPPAAPDLSRFPDTLESWQKLREDPLPADVATAMKADQVLSRTYLRPSGGETAGLLVAWFQSQRGGERQPHSPKVCLPGSGWEPASTGEITIPTPSGPVTANRYIVTNRTFRLAILYWYETPRGPVTGEWGAKFALVSQALRDRRTDTALVRVVAQVGPGGDDAAVRAAADFTAQMYPALKTALPKL